MWLTVFVAALAGLLLVGTFIASVRRMKLESLICASGAGALLLLAEVCLRALFFEGRKLPYDWVVHGMVIICVLLFGKTLISKRNAKFDP